MGSILEAVNILSSVIGAANALMAQSAQISAMISKAQAENRTTFTPEEWAAITGADDAARKLLADAIAKSEA